MSARFVMLPSSTGDFVLDPEKIIYARARDSAASEVVLLGNISITVTAPIEKVRALATTLRLAAEVDGTTCYFNHQHLVFASTKSDWMTLAFPNNTSVRAATDHSETLLDLLNRLESERDQT